MSNLAYLTKALERGGATVSAISPGASNVPCNGRVEVEAQLRRLGRAFALAEALGTRGVIIRGFLPAKGRKSDVCPGAVIGALGEPARRRPSRLTAAPAQHRPRLCRHGRL